MLHEIHKKQFVLDSALENHENLNDYAVLNFETCWEQYLGNVNFQKPELIAGLSDQHRQFFCWTDAVFAGLGHRSGGLFRRLQQLQYPPQPLCHSFEHIQTLWRQWHMAMSGHPIYHFEWLRQLFILLWASNIVLAGFMPALGRHKCHRFCVKEVVACTNSRTHTSRDHFVYASSQWETTLQCNIVSH